MLNFKAIIYIELTFHLQGCPLSSIESVSSLCAHLSSHHGISPLSFHKNHPVKHKALPPLLPLTLLQALFCVT